MESLQLLQDALLISAYENAIKLNLSKDFINILFAEIVKRKLLITDIA